jgi:ABC-2 type transport system permease protein
MKAYWQLTKAQLLLFARNKNTFIWSLFLPVFMMVALGTLLGDSGGQLQLTAAVADEDHSAASSEMVKELKKTSGLSIKEVDAALGLRQVKAGDVQLLIRLKDGLGKRVSQVKAKERASSGELIQIYVDQSNPAASQIGTQVIQQWLNEYNQKLVHFQPAVKAKKIHVQSRPLEYIDFLVPGILSLMIMSNNLNGVAATIASWRERGILRRMQGTPLRASTFIVGQITARILLNGLQALAVLLVAYFVYDVHVYGSWIGLIAFILLGTLTFMSIGFIIASLSRTPESAAPIAGLVSFPMIFVGGIFFPVRDLPGILQPLVKAIPIGYLTDALRGIMNEGAGILQLWAPAAVLSAWLIVSFAVAAWSFRWDVK